MKVIDNFLEENDFIKIQNKFLSETCKWEWSNVVENDNSFYNFQFVHGVYLPTVLLKKGYDPEDIFRKITIPEMPDIKPLLESFITSKNEQLSKHLKENERMMSQTLEKINNKFEPKDI